jgi:ubiquinone/menaquinone biosynthesis C-methylase UbiE
MNEKKNLIANWNTDYKNLPTTYAEHYETTGEIAVAELNATVLEDIQACLKNPANARVLEVGCGGARTSLYLSLRGLDVTGLDSSPEAIALGKRNFAKFGAKAHFVQADFMTADLPLNSFDCVMSYGLLEHFEDEEPIIRRMTAMLKEEGIHIHTIIPKKFSTETLLNTIWFPFRLVKNILHGKMDRILSRSFREFPHYENSLTAEQNCELFSKNGNVLVKCVAMGSIYPFISLPAGCGNFLVRNYEKQVAHLMRWANRSESKLMHFLSPMMYVVFRKATNPAH